MNPAQRSNFRRARSAILSPVEPAGEEHTHGKGDIDHVPALQTLVAVQRNLVEDMFERGVRPEGEEKAQQSDEVPRPAFAGGQT